MTYNGILLEIKDHIAILTLNRPDQQNTLTLDMMDTELPGAIEAIQQNDDARVAIITGAGEAFCIGTDIEVLCASENSEVPSRTRYATLAQRGVFAKYLMAMNKPVIAAINGVAAGSGLSLAMACDFRIAGSRAEFHSAFINRSMIPDSGLAYTLTYAIGLSRALRMMLLDEKIDAAEAERIGLVDKVVSAENLLSECFDMAQRLVSLPPIAVELTKRVARKAMNDRLESQFDFETRAQNICLDSEDFKEARRALLENRKPMFEGR